MSAIIPAPKEDDFMAAIVKPFQPGVMFRIYHINYVTFSRVFLFSNKGMGLNNDLDVFCNISHIYFHEVDSQVYAGILRWWNFKSALLGEFYVLFWNNQFSR